MNDTYDIELRKWAIEQAQDLVLSVFEEREAHNRPLKPNTYVGEVLAAAERFVGFIYDDEDEDEEGEDDGEEFDGPEGDPLMSVKVNVYDEGILVTISGED